MYDNCHSDCQKHERKGKDVIEDFYFKEIIADRDNERLDRFLRRNYVSIRLSVLQSFIRSGKVLVNDKRIKDGAFRVQIGQRIIVKVPGSAEEISKRYGRTSPQQIPLEMELEVLYEDKDLVALNKPSGLSVQPGTNIANKSLYNALLGKMKSFFFVHRLDKYTSGVIVIAKNYEMARKLSELFSSHEIEKKYLTLVKGLVKSSMDVKTPLDGKYAFTHIEPVDFFTRYTLLEVQIFTGRKHQIRKHLSSIDFPVIGDDLYGDRDENEFFRKKYGLKGYFLHCSELSFVHPLRHVKVTIKAQLDKEKADILGRL